MEISFDMFEPLLTTTTTTTKTKTPSLSAKADYLNIHPSPPSPPIQQGGNDSSTPTRDTNKLETWVSVSKQKTFIYVKQFVIMSM